MEVEEGNWKGERLMLEGVEGGKKEHKSIRTVQLKPHNIQLRGAIQRGLNLGA